MKKITKKIFDSYSLEEVGLCEELDCGRVSINIKRDNGAMMFCGVYHSFDGWVSELGHNYFLGSEKDDKDDPNCLLADYECSPLDAEKIAEQAKDYIDSIAEATVKFQPIDQKSLSHYLRDVDTKTKAKLNLDKHEANYKNIRKNQFMNTYQEYLKFSLNDMIDRKKFKLTIDGKSDDLGND